MAEASLKPSASMASFMIQPPEPFCFTSPNEWPKWKKRFERFRTASGLCTKPEEHQIDAFLYIMGDQSEDVLSTFQLSAEDSKNFDVVLQRFDSYFIPKRNIIFERARFNMRSQQDGESIEEFATTLHTLSKDCDYGNLREQLVRDRFVVGIQDSKLSAKLQLNAELTLQTALETARQVESVRKQQEELNQDRNSNVHKISSSDKEKTASTALSTNKREGPDDRRQRENTPYQQRPLTMPSDNRTRCRWCGRDTHPRTSCPARSKVCTNCHKKGHFSEVCLSKRVDFVEAPGPNVGFLGIVTSPQVNSWEVDVLIQSEPVRFKIDTGADETVIPPAVFNKLEPQPLLQNPPRQLRGPDGKALAIQGVVRLAMSYKDRVSEQNIYVLQDVTIPLLGKPAIEGLQLLSPINRIETTVNPKVDFPSLFTGLGTFPGEYHLQLQENAKPFALSSPRRVPIPLYEKTKQELQRMEDIGVISPVSDPTEWCAPMVIVPKRTGAVRICVDFTELNRYVLREWHPIPSVEHTLGLLQGAKIFSKLDANSGFWQIPLSDESKKFTTFITPFGRFCFNRLPFGISSAPEHFQKQLSSILEGLSGVVCLMDDVLIWGSCKEEHDERLRNVLEKICSAGITLNKDKCLFGVQELTFLGHRIDSLGIRPDISKLKAVMDMPPPTSRTELQRVLGMATYLARFVANFAEILQPLTAMLSKKQEFVWGPVQQNAFDRWKAVLSSEPVLGIYDANKETVVTADASSYGLGAILRQRQDDGRFQVIAYASRLLTDTEKRYAQIEKEGLASVWACEKFSDYLVGKTFKLETDHKPLVSLFSSKSLNDLTPRLQRMRMRMMRYTYEITYVPGKQLMAADTLSRAPLPLKESSELEEEVEAFVQFVRSTVPAVSSSLQWLIDSQEKDPVCQQIRYYCKNTWPCRRDLNNEVKPFYPFRHQFTFEDDLLMFTARILVPTSCRSEILRLLHEGHFGIEKTQARAKETLWWPGMMKEIEEKVKSCHLCIEGSTNRKMPLKPTELPERPWQRIAMDLFYQKGQWWLIVTDYFSRYPEIARLENTTAQVVVNHCKSIFARHGIPEVVVSDNGPQFSRVSTSEFATFAREYGFQHITSSPHYPQSNGLAEAAVKIIKSSMNKTRDPYETLLSYRTTPLKNGYSPAELLMGRRLRSKLPIPNRLLRPTAPNLEQLAKFETSYRLKQRSAYDKHHGVRHLPDIVDGTDVWVVDLQRKGTVQCPTSEPRSYLVDTGQSVVRRNRTHLVPYTNETTQTFTNFAAPADSDGQEVPQEGCEDASHPHTRTGRCIRRPSRYLDD